MKGKFLFIFILAGMIIGLTGCQLMPNPVNPGSSSSSFSSNSSSSDSSVSSSSVSAVVQYTITAGAGANGTINPSNDVKVNSGTSQRFTVTPDFGYHLESLTIDGIEQGNIYTSYTLSNVQANHTVTAAFAVNKYKIIILNDVDASGRISTNLFFFSENAGTVNSKNAYVKMNDGSPIDKYPIILNVNVNDILTLTSTANVTVISTPLNHIGDSLTNTSDYNCSATIHVSDLLANPSAYEGGFYSYDIVPSPGPFSLSGTYSIFLVQ